MNKIIPVIILSLFLFACGDDDNGESGGGNGNNTIDKKILGKWKVEYSKYSNSAKYNEETGEFIDNENANIIEYFGNFGEPNIVPRCGMFDMKEVNIEVKESNTIIIAIAGANNKTISYTINNGCIIWSGITARYSIEGNTLVIEKIKNINGQYPGTHTISKYSKITE